MAQSSEMLRLAVRLTVRAPGRTALTMVGLALGVGPFIAMVRFGEGARRSVVSQFEVLGSNLLKVQPLDSGASPRARPPGPLSDTDVSSIEREATTIDRVYPVNRRNGSISRLGEQRPTMLYGV